MSKYRGAKIFYGLALAAVALGAFIYVARDAQGTYHMELAADQKRRECSESLQQLPRPAGLSDVRLKQHMEECIRYLSVRDYELFLAR